MFFGIGFERYAERDVFSEINSHNINSHNKIAALAFAFRNEARTFCFCFICFIFNLLLLKSMRISRRLQIY